MSGANLEIAITMNDESGGQPIHNIRNASELSPDELAALELLLAVLEDGHPDTATYDVQVKQGDQIFEIPGIPRVILFSAAPLRALVTGISWKPGAGDLMQG